MRANFVMSGVATGIRRNVTMTVALVLSTAIALAFVGAAILANIEITRFRHDYESRLNVSLYLCTATKVAGCSAQTTAAQTAALRSQLESDPDVTSVKYVSEAEQVARYKKTASPHVAKLTAVGDLPASFTVTLHSIKNDYSSFVRTYRGKPGVSGATNASKVLNTLLKIIDGARLFSIVIAIVVLVASILLIANTIQVAAAQRRNETSIMRLVGASRWMTELPFMIEAIIAAVVGGLIALGLIALGKQFVLDGIFHSPVERGTIPNLNVNDVLVAGGVGLIAGIVLAAVTAFLTLRLYVRL